MAAMVGHQRGFTCNVCAKVMAPPPKKPQKWDPTVETAQWELLTTTTHPVLLNKPQGGWGGGGGGRQQCIPISSHHPAQLLFYHRVMALDCYAAFIHIYPAALQCRYRLWRSAETCLVTGPRGQLWGHWQWGHGAVHGNSNGRRGRAGCAGWPAWEQGWHGSRAVSATQAEAPTLPPGSAAPRRLPAPHRNRQLESKQCLKPILIRLIYE